MMSENLQDILQAAASKILRPLVRVMLRNGVACGTFEQMVRKAYVDEAYSMAENQRQATISAISAQTGLSRKEVKRLHELGNANDNHNSQKYNRAIRVMSAWMNDTRFISEAGIPRALDMQGSDSFASLVKDYSGDIPPRAMFDLLIKSGCVEQLDDKINLISHAYVPGSDPEEIINILGTDTSELMNTVIHNMSCEQSQRHFQRKVSTGQLASAHVSAFQKYANRRSQALLEDLDNWLSDHEYQASQATQGDTQYVSLGIYYFQGEPEQESKK